MLRCSGRRTEWCGVVCRGGAAGVGAEDTVAVALLRLVWPVRQSGNTRRHLAQPTEDNAQRLRTSAAAAFRPLALAESRSAEGNRGI